MHSQDPQTSRISARFDRVIPSRDDEDVDVRAPGTDRLLPDRADRLDRSVEAELSRGRDPVAAVDVMAELLVEVESEGEPGGGAADVPRVDRDRERELDRRRLLD